MHPHVDGPAQRIVCGDRTWPFEVDFRNGSVSIELAGRTYRVRPLLWREKRTLARFSALGEAFLTNQFVRLSLADSGMLPRNPEEVGVLYELARWFSAPDENEPLPFHAATLAKVTFHLCRAMRLAPEHFDARESCEVELLWATLSSESTTFDNGPLMAPTEQQFAASSKSSETTTIVILPDPAVGGQASAKPEVAAVDDSDVEEIGATAMTEDLASMTAGDPQRAPPRRATEWMREPTEWMREPTERFRVARSSAGPTPEIPKLHREPPSIPKHRDVEPSRVDRDQGIDRPPAMAMESVTEDGVRSPSGSLPTDGTSRTDGAPAEAGSWVSAVSRALTLDSRMLLATLPRVVRERHIDATVRVRPLHFPAPDDFAEELRQAAAQMGIDVES
jgi:hypothetical protein